MAFKFKVKKCTPIFVFAKCCWLVHSKVVRLGNNAHSKQRKATPTQTLQFHVKFMYMPCWFSIYIVYFFNIWFWYGLTSETAWMQRRQKNWLKHTDFTELKKITVELTQTVRIILYFSSPSNFVAVRFVSFKKCTVNCTSVLLIFGSNYINTEYNMDV